MMIIIIRALSSKVPVMGKLNTLLPMTSATVSSIMSTTTAFPRLPITTTADDSAFTKILSLFFEDILRSQTLTAKLELNLNEHPLIDMHEGQMPLVQCPKTAYYPVTITCRL